MNAAEALMAAEDAHSADCRELRNAGAAFTRSKSKVRAAAYIAAEAAFEASLAKVKAARRALEAADRAEIRAERAAKAAAQPQQLNLF